MLNEVRVRHQRAETRYQKRLARRARHVKHQRNARRRAVYSREHRAVAIVTPPEKKMAVKVILPAKPKRLRDQFSLFKSFQRRP